ncbi:unnamed protein product [Ectocarpus fasciculatus]
MRAGRRTHPGRRRWTTPPSWLRCRRSCGARSCSALTTLCSARCRRTSWRRRWSCGNASRTRVTGSIVSAPTNLSRRSSKRRRRHRPQGMLPELGPARRRPRRRAAAAARPGARQALRPAAGEAAPRTLPRRRKR